MEESYWKRTLKLLAQLLAVWFLVSFVFGILLVDILNSISIFGVPLGFWFAQQGSIYVFVVLIFVYARKMRTVDREYGVDD